MKSTTAILILFAGLGLATPQHNIFQREDKPGCKGFFEKCNTRFDCCGWKDCHPVTGLCLLGASPGSPQPAPSKDSKSA
ncbi:hypothetical protein HIM_06185 [Hirsutella minnesotensis 3608]|uniref:Uncharacterized protein n=1 Tax=Hirsutella minnesotensis 3608 TaxID=1043627 RepID=A0A0F7ZNU8_9HYPO|nr:hypothetical protein HIM_06185 [Hirsutella minnesotensis 3608]